jgi:hypothetical protein
MMFSHCWLYTPRAAANGRTFHIIATGVPEVSRFAISDTALAQRDDISRDCIEVTADPFFERAGRLQGTVTEQTSRSPRRRFRRAADWRRL